ncbi:MAG TPA: hypothetical protein VFD31_07770 [Thermoleophilaceae bacterium]|nr:hypothetical protein [Thermoleophilaceae bacterium]
MPKLMPNPLGDIQKPLERMEKALVEVRTEVERLSKVESEISTGFDATCERLDRIVELLEAQAAPRPAVARKGRAAA